MREKNHRATESFRFEKPCKTLEAQQLPQHYQGTTNPSATKKVVSTTPQHGSCPLPAQPAAPTGLSTNRDQSSLPRAPLDVAGATSLGVQHPGKDPGLTGAAEALLADPQQHGAAEVAVGRFLEVLQPPGMLPIILHVLQGRRVEGEGVTPLLPRVPALSAQHFDQLFIP